jgi:nucleolar pre-ribosomal-associated protein 1
MEIYRRANVFERFLSLYHSPGLTNDLRKKIIHLLARACQIGGSTTLLTRVAALSWVRSQAAGADPHEAILRKLAQDMYACCDRERVNTWSSGAISGIVADIAEGKAGVGESVGIVA